MKSYHSLDVNISFYFIFLMSPAIGSEHRAWYPTGIHLVRYLIRSSLNKMSCDLSLFINRLPNFCMSQGTSKLTDVKAQRWRGTGGVFKPRENDACLLETRVCSTTPTRFLSDLCFPFPVWMNRIGHMTRPSLQ